MLSTCSGVQSNHLHPVQYIVPHALSITLSLAFTCRICRIVRGTDPFRPPLTKEQEEKLVDVIIKHTPDEVGFPPRKNWNLGIIREWIKRNFEVEYSQSGMADALHRLNLSYSRPTYTLKQADPEKQENFINDFETIKKLVNEEIDHVLFEDESMIRDYQAIQKTWFIKGKQRIVPTYGKHEGVKLVGVLNYETGAVYCEEHAKYDAEVFLGFLKNVVDSYSNGRIVLILDNARIHHAKLLQPYLDSMKERLELVFLPPYSPNLNIIEGLWKWLKSEVINNVFFPNVCQIQKAVRSFIKYIIDIPSVVIDRLCVKM